VFEAELDEKRERQLMLNVILPAALQDVSARLQNVIVYFVMVRTWKNNDKESQRLAIDLLHVMGLNVQVRSHIIDLTVLTDSLFRIVLFHSKE
jgi:hypothetical protein